MAIGLGLVGGLALLVAGVAAAAFFGMPVVAATAISWGIASFLLPTMIGAAVISGLSFATMGLLLASRSHVKGLKPFELRIGSEERDVPSKVPTL